MVPHFFILMALWLLSELHAPFPLWVGSHVSVPFPLLSGPTSFSWLMAHSAGGG